MWEIFLSGVSGVIITIVVNYFLQKGRTKKEHQSLILAFASEFVDAFERCVVYCEQREMRGVSYSGLFSFTGASVFARFASINDEPQIVEAVFNLKSAYFQVARHVDEASKFISQARRIAVTKEEKERFEAAARHAQGTALAFFLGDPPGPRYEEIKKHTKLIVDDARKICPGKVTEGLLERFCRAVKNKAEIDNFLPPMINPEIRGEP